MKWIRVVNYNWMLFTNLAFPLRFSKAICPEMTQTYYSLIPTIFGSHSSERLLNVDLTTKADWRIVE
ncbi:UNVERIFIED_CONTAM: hypothetical protein NCL1_42098 [Trichonephila clavipes]